MKSKYDSQEEKKKNTKPPKPDIQNQLKCKDLSSESR